MESFEDDLFDDESIIFQVRHSPVLLWRPTAVALGYAAAWIAAASVLDGLRRGWLFWLGFALLLAVLAWAAGRFLSWSRAYLVLTDRRLLHRSGLFSRRTREVTLPRISDMAVYQTFAERLLGYGDIVVEVSGDSPGTLPYVGLPRPGKLKKQIQEQVHASRQDPSEAGSVAREVVHAINRNQPTIELPKLPPERAPSYTEIVDQIERLDRLRERGSLSEEEFSRAKTALLERMSRGDS